MDRQTRGQAARLDGLSPASCDDMRRGRPLGGKSRAEHLFVVSPRRPSAPSSRVAPQHHICCGDVMLSVAVGILRQFPLGQPTIAATSSWALRRPPRSQALQVRASRHMGLVYFPDWAATIYRKVSLGTRGSCSCAYASHATVRSLAGVPRGTGPLFFFFMLFKLSRLSLSPFPRTDRTRPCF